MWINFVDQANAANHYTTPPSGTYNSDMVRHESIVLCLQISTTKAVMQTMLTNSILQEVRNSQAIWT